MRRQAVVAQVHRQHARTGRQRRRDVVPLRGAAEQAVQQHQRRPGSGRMAGAGVVTA
ncbi:hypothetical protein QRD40_15685 [Comamonas sp. Y6]|uniref:Uncharacterized protein n=1 Tax=Comamonas resistens TaxID=3046670 RepID=A0ABY8SYQ0_9BURK|nr:hypothetical protein [Comamonas resistens]MDL5037791.1 hypothetical protein [Comamonas resistens]WHS68058.1 hypothetical protein QMY55_11065 [Comamonas resistens]